jgi:hypothetical protein
MEEAIRAMAKRFLNLSPLILSIQKDILDNWFNLSHDQRAEYSAKTFALFFTSDHPWEDMDAFLENAILFMEANESNTFISHRALREHRGIMR